MAEEKKEEKKTETRKESPPALACKTVRIGGKPVEYESRTGHIFLRDEDGEPKARIFFTAYTRTGVEDISKRPVTFAFNGGPGSSSIWLHMGAFGPWRVRMPDAEFAEPPATAGRPRARRKSSFTASRRISKPWANSSGFTRHATAAGRPQNTLPAKATAPSGRRASRFICRSATACM